MLTGEDCNLRSIWKTTDDSNIVLHQFLLVSKTLLDTENASIKKINDNITIAIVHKNDQLFTFWNDDIYAYTLITSDLDENEIIKIVKSIK